MNTGLRAFGGLGILGVWCLGFRDFFFFFFLGGGGGGGLGFRVGVSGIFRGVGFEGFGGFAGC